MSSLPVFTDQNQGSATEIMAAFQYLYNLGQTNLSNLDSIRTNSLLACQRRVSYLNSKQQQANKLTNQSSLVNFSLADFSNIDQSETTATVRIDSNVVSSLEQAIEVEAVVKSISFTSNVGSVETLNSNSNIYRVYNTNNQTPSGTFLITLREALNLSVIVFDLPSVASDPEITVKVSETNVSYTSCISYSLNGYRLIAYLNPAEIQYIELTITPTHPDNLGGSLYTFGVTDFVASSTQYRLLSEFVTKPLDFSPSSLNCQLSTLPTDGILYFLSLAGNNYNEIEPNTNIQIPGVVETNISAATVNSIGLISSVLPSNVYLQTLTVIDNSSGTELPIVFNLSRTDPNIGNITKTYISVVGNNLYYIPYESGDSSKTFSVNYLSGPSSVSAQLKIQISTIDKNSSPIFNGAVLLAS